MKYLPLVWAALWRKPARTILTLLAAIAAFTLFGLAIGLNSTYAHLIAMSRMDRLYVTPRFDVELTLAQREQLARLPGVTKIGFYEAFLGYYRDPKNLAVPAFVDKGMRDVWTDMPLTPAQWDQLEATPNGVFISRRIAARLRLKKGDALPVLTATPSRADGSRLWPLTVLGVMEDRPLDRAGLILGNYDYFDRARTIAERGWVYQYQLVLKDPALVDQTADRIDAMFANSPNRTWSISERTLTESSTRFQFNIPLITEGVAGAGLFMILFLTGNVIAQSVRERIAEFAILKTLGFSDAGVMVLVFVEAAIPCLMGAGIGFALAAGINHWLPGLALPPSVGIALPDLSLKVLGLAFVFAILVAFASAVIPALRIRRLDVATALRR